jgi:AraC-like DNA-binding protein
LQPPYYNTGSFKVAPAVAQPVPHTALPDGYVSLIVFRTEPLAQPTALWAGPRTTHFQQIMAPGSAFAGIQFVPGAARALFGLNMEGLKNAARPAQLGLEQYPLLTATVGQLATLPLRPAALDGLLEAAGPGTPDRLVAPLVAQILASHGRVNIGELTRQASRSERQVQKCFEQAVGRTMKELARSRRLRATVVALLLANSDYFGTLEAAGYFDQAHFSHDFGDSAGTSLREFRNYIGRIRHTDVKA